MEHAAAQSLERPFPWRTIALAAGAVSLAELLVLLVVAGVRLAPASHARAATTATVATIAPSAASGSGAPAAARNTVAMPPSMTNSPWAKLMMPVAL